MERVGPLTVTCVRASTPAESDEYEKKKEAWRIASLKRVNVRVVLCLLSGRPLVIPPETLEQCDACVACWLPGTEGDGVADVLFGDAPFTGRLSFSWPKTNAQATLGARSGTRTRGQVPLFPLGFGEASTPISRNDTQGANVPL